jgi:catechol 2,3-dioxygenase-like lactoylglutathione lyase family enzyme
VLSMRPTHVGVTVRNLEGSVRFWSVTLGRAPVSRRLFSGEYLSRVTKYEAVAIDVAEFLLTESVRLELCEYVTEKRAPLELEPATPGASHVAFGSDELDAVYERALEAGAEAISPGLVEITDGPNRGNRMAYLRTPDGLLLELSGP